MDSQKHSPDLTPEEKLKIENDLLKAKLTAEFGMKNSESGLDDSMENEWLNHIYDFEKAYANSSKTSIYDFIGKPEFKTADKLNKDEIKSELDRLFTIMHDNAIVLDVLCDYENEDELIYKFITEELFSEEIDDVKIRGVNHCFIYEEFHTNHKYDLIQESEAFIFSIFEREWYAQYDSHRLAESIEFIIKTFDRDTISKFILEFQNTFMPFELKSKEVRDVDFDLEKGKAEVIGILFMALL